MNSINKNNNKLLINYKKLTSKAMKNVIYDILKQVSKKGLPGKHHFYISFDTTAKNIKIPEKLIKEYPQEMTIVIENSFWNLEVTKSNIVIVLSFSEIKSKLKITFDSIISFSDPHANFILQFPKLKNEKILLDKTKNKKSSKIINIQDFKKGQLSE